MKERLVASRHGRPNPLSLCRPAPVRRCRYGPSVRSEPDEHTIMAVLLTDELSYIPLARSAHLGGACVAQVRVVRPNDELAALMMQDRVLRVNPACPPCGHPVDSRKRCVPGTWCGNTLRRS